MPATIGALVGIMCGAGSGCRTGNPATIGTALALCLVMTLVGSLLPALRAVRVSPLDAVRNG